MTDGISRRNLLKTAGGVGASLWLPSLALAQASPQEILPLTSNSGVFIPPRGKSFMKFSFDFPEPSVAFEGLLFSFRLHTFENTYGIDGDKIVVTEHEDGIEIASDGLVWAGGQQKAPGSLRARIRKTGGALEWTVEAEAGHDIKSVATILRGVPRGRISAGGLALFDPGEDEVLFGYPFGVGAATGVRHIATPLVAIERPDEGFFVISGLNESVRPNRFYLQPGPDGYRAEIIYEAAGWQRDKRIESCRWRISPRSGLEDAYRAHYAHLERAFKMPAWESRTDMPGWLRDISLVVSLHGMHWTGYIFNDFAKMRRILDWLATKAPAERVLVFIPAWDGRYYWNYPLYEPDPLLGGEDGFRALIESGQELGYRFMPMFGANTANRLHETHPRYADGETRRVDGDPYYLNLVEWDNDRHNEGWMPFMNLGVESWRNWLSERISAIIERFGVDAYFLDISGRWLNNPDGDMDLGGRALVETLRERHPEVLACGEYYYDVQLGYLPLQHSFSQRAYPQALLKYARAFMHLSHPAPGRGSSGVHESGFRELDPETLGIEEGRIPTITVVDDTFERHRDVMEEIARRAFGG